MKAYQAIALTALRTLSLPTVRPTSSQQGITFLPLLVISVCRKLTSDDITTDISLCGLITMLGQLMTSPGAEITNLIAWLS